MYLCPKCGSENLEVVVEVWAKLNQNPDGEFETDADLSEDGSHDWDENSVMKCVDCYHHSIAGGFKKGN